MKNKLSQIPVFFLMTIFLFGASCYRPLSKNTQIKRQQLEKNIGNVSSSFQDKSGDIWFGTANGFYRYDGKSFRESLLSDGQKINDVSCLLKDKNGKIWIGTGDGLVLYDGKTFSKFKIPLPKDLPRNTNSEYQKQWVFSMLEAKDGKIWLATLDGLYICDGKTFTLFLINEAPNGFLSKNAKVERMLEDREGNIWFGARVNEGVFRYDGKTITNFKLSPTTVEIANCNWAWPQMQDKDGNIWFSNWGGAYRYDGKEFISFTKNDGLSGTGLVAKIIEDKKGTIWLGGDGLSRYDGNAFTSFREGLVNPGIWSLIEEKSGHIWVGTREAGFYLFDGKRFINYSENKE
ncbi:hypothetical protein GVN16_09760 [Emticicia sp. CRIBPO]|uniref:ligand-binding sensor domain-containing protein n=1 Tax=Emticicia sp. CRIBPO TaxID=2683258 RepID=UPI0014120056|nr:two-component regulator propeller domain-containing protein [Emticicia sp. CRIBPO]NBA86047.1 hypothetical protein [Emticicia sp. CRIBPO]